jgi:hypothetical protein
MAIEPVGDLELPNLNFNIIRENDQFKITSPLVDLDSNGIPLKFSVTLEKMPTRFEDGEVIEGIRVDREGQKLHGMLQEAAAFREFPAD